MLRKPALVTVIPGSPGQPYRAASRTCTPLRDGTDVVPDPPPTTPPAGTFVPEPGTPIVLETPGVGGTVDVAVSVAPAPSGYVCRLEVFYFSVPGSLEPAVLYNVVCSHPDLLP